MPTADQLAGDKKIQAGDEFVLHDEGANELNSRYTEAGEHVFNSGDIICYPGYTNLDVKYPWSSSSYWMQYKDDQRFGFQVPRYIDLFSEINPSGKERR